MKICFLCLYNSYMLQPVARLGLLIPSDAAQGNMASATSEVVCACM